MQEVVVDLAPILHEIGVTLEARGDIELERLCVGEETFTFEGPARYDVSVTNTAAGFVAQGYVHARVHAECARCLEAFPLELEGTVDAFYVTPAHADGLPEEQEYDLVRDGRVDLFPAIEASLAVEAPFAPLHSEECRGICARCGANLNVEDCGCPGEESESPFGALKDMLDERRE